MKSGEKIICPHCGDRSVVKEKKLYDDGFSLVGRRFVCALCGAELPEPAEQSPAPPTAPNKLASFLGVELPRKAAFVPEADDGHFCLHCRHWMKHPFRSVCARTLRDAEATGSCDGFELKVEEK